MGNPVTIKIVRDGLIVDTAMSTDWNISMDRLSPEDSTFTLDLEKHDILEGDQVIVEQMGDPYGFHYIKPQLITESGSIFNNVVTPLYIGVVSSYDLVSIVTRDMVYYYHNQKVVERSWQGNHPSEYLLEVFNQFIVSSGNQITKPNFIIQSKEAIVSGNKDFKRLIQRASATDMNKLLFTMLKYYQVICTAAGYQVNKTTRKISFHLIYHNILNDLWTNDEVKSKNIDMNNAKKVVDSSVKINIQQSIVSGTNCTNLILQTDTNNIQRNPPQKWYMQNDGLVTKTPDISKLSKPLIIDTVVYDPPQQGDPAYTDDDYRSFAAANMSKDTYAHNITFDYILDHTAAIPEWILKLGQPVNIMYNGKHYSSFISGWEMDSTNNVIKIVCGNIRTNLALYMRNK